MVPPDQGLSAEDAAGRSLHLGLVDDAELLLGHAPDHLRLQLVVAHEGIVHAGAKGEHGVAADIGSAAGGQTCKAYQIFCRSGIAGPEGDPGGNLDHGAGSEHAHGGEGIHDGLNAPSFLAVEVLCLEGDQEATGAIAADEGAGIHGGAQGLGHAGDKGVGAAAAPERELAAQVEHLDPDHSDLAVWRGISH